MKPPSFIPFELFRNSIKNHKQNNFVQFLKTLFPNQTIKKLIIDFFIGTSSHWPGATVFWQIDQDDQVLTSEVHLQFQVFPDEPDQQFPDVRNEGV